MIQHERVLVADDDASIRKLICTLVRREGSPVDAAVDGEQAIELLRKNRYAVILLDLMMPRLDGFGVIRFLKEQNLDPKPMVFVITAYGDQAFRHVDPEVVSGIIHKPFDVGEVGSLVRQCALGMKSKHDRQAMDSDRARSLMNFNRFVQRTAPPPDHSTDS